MGEFSGIEWTDHTFNPWVGCNRVSPACDNCYAAKDIFTKFNGIEWGKNTPRFLTDTPWQQAIRWNKKAGRDGVRRRVFCASLSDVFDDHPDVIETRQRLWNMIEMTTNLDWLLLTKRPGKILKMMPEAGFPENVWLGTTAENQEFAKGRIKQLLRAPASLHFLSCEPLLGPLDLSEWLPELDWVIAGGETGANSRPADPDWYRSLRDQCEDAGVAFHFKQWGVWTPHKPDAANSKSIEEFGTTLFRVNKKVAGRLLDGRTWDGMP